MIGTDRVLVRTAGALTAFTFALLVVGASVRLKGAGLACPDWPLCFGEVVPPLDVQVAFEFGHRVFAGGVSLGFLALAGLAAARRSALPKGTGTMLGIAAVVLAVQVVLGGLTVLELLAEWTVASHLLAGNTFCALLLLVTLHLQDGGAAPRPAVSRMHRVAAIGLGALVVGQLVLGGFVSSSHAGLACGTWPGCNGGPWFPTLSGLIGLQVAHRLVAYTLLGASIAVAVVFRGRGNAGVVAIVLAVAVSLQATLGALNVLLRIPFEISLLHTAGAAAVFLGATWLNYEAWRAPLGLRRPALAPPPRPAEAR